MAAQRPAALSEASNAGVEALHLRHLLIRVSTKEPYDPRKLAE